MYVKTLLVEHGEQGAVEGQGWGCDDMNEALTFGAKFRRVCVAKILSTQE